MGNPGTGLDIASTLSEFEDGTHLYYCGPRGVMNSVEEGAAHWPKENVHFEHFGPVASFEPSVGEKNQPFQIKIARTGEV